MKHDVEIAARDAHDALHMSVEATEHDPGDGLHYDVEVSPALDDRDGGLPIVQRDGLTPAAALAYLEGLSQGAHIATVRHERLVTAARGLIDNQDPSGVACFDDMGWLETALAELEE